jgi:hypothetical protein
MNTKIDKVAILANEFLIKTSQAKPNANIEYYMQTVLADLINSKYNTIGGFDKIIIELVKLSKFNSIILHFMFGNKDVNRTTSEVATQIESDYIDLLKANPKMSIIFDSTMFAPFKITLDKKLLKLVKKQPNATNRNIRETL